MEMYPPRGLVDDLTKVEAVEDKEFAESWGTEMGEKVLGLYYSFAKDHFGMRI